MSLSSLLILRRGEILTAFVTELERKELAPSGLARPVLVDHIPVFLDEIAAELTRISGARTSLEAVAVDATARQHGEQRWQVGYDLRAVVREYGVLLEVILEAASSAGEALSIDELKLLTRYVNVGVAAATAQYVGSREEELRSRQADLEFLSEAGELLASSLDYQSTLTRLTRLLVPHLADFCVVNLDGESVPEMPMAHVNPAMVPIMRDVLGAFPPPGPPTHAQVARTGESLLVESLPAGFLERVAQSPEHLQGLERLGARSWIVVPLKIKASVFGTISLGMAESRRVYDRANLAFAEELARRAAAAIDNARLYELSKKERARAEAAARTKDEFVAMVSHELRTPLNVIIGWLRILRTGTLPESTREQALEVIERNANAQSQLVGDLLDMSRVMAGKIRLEPTQVDLGGVVALVLEDARLALEAKQLEVHTSIPAEGAVLRGDAERLRQVVWNLVLNSIKFTPKGGRVWVTARRVDSDLELSVRDSGVGMPPEFLAQVFETFRQVDSTTTRAHGGLGIGLSIVKHLVDLHGGSIEGRSEGPDKGAEFIVRLPISPLISSTLEVAKVPATAPKPRPFAPPTGLVGFHVLVVDDDEDARELLRIVLQSCDVNVHVASSAKEALAVVRSEQIDLIVSDIGMPEEDGYSLIRAVRALPGSSAVIPALALTAFASNEDRTRALLEGFNAHMTKPVEPADLLQMLGDMVHPARNTE